MATPTITLTANLQDICGAHAGSTANPAKLRIALAPGSFQGSLPRISGTSNIAEVGPETFYDTGAGISISLWGNDVIAPANTWYEIAVLDGEDNIVQCAAYQFSGTETVDLSTLTPFNPPPYPSYAPPIGNAACTPTGPQSAGATYTAPGPVIAVFYQGNYQGPTFWSVVAGSPAQFTLNFAIYAGDTVYALYIV